MHHANNMVGEITAAHATPLWRRYFHMSKHRKPGKVWKKVLNAVTSVDLMIGSLAYAR